MNGLTLAERYFTAYGLPMLKNSFADRMDRIACGLAGEGSECFGFDDELSRDHDWGAAFCLWLTDDDYAAFGQDLAEAYNALPDTVDGFSRRKESPMAAGRSGVLRISDFYARFTGCPDGPHSLAEWQRIPESFLAVATNGRVFSDPLGRFSSIRRRLLDFYPEDIRLKKLSYQCHRMGQAGQYNYVRLLRRNDAAAALLALSEFSEAAMKTVYLLNRRYAPYYKWIRRGLTQLDRLSGLGEKIDALCALPPLSPRHVKQIEAICNDVLAELFLQDLTADKSTFLCDQSFALLQNIQDPFLQSLPVSMDCC